MKNIPQKNPFKGLKEAQEYQSLKNRDDTAVLRMKHMRVKVHFSGVFSCRVRRVSLSDGSQSEKSTASSPSLWNDPPALLKPGGNQVSGRGNQRTSAPLRP